MEVLIKPKVWMKLNHFFLNFRWLGVLTESVSWTNSLFADFDEIKRNFDENQGREISLELARNRCNVAIIDTDLRAARETEMDCRLQGVKAKAYRVSECFLFFLPFSKTKKYFFNYLSRPMQQITNKWKRWRSRLIMI